MENRETKEKAIDKLLELDLPSAGDNPVAARLDAAFTHKNARPFKDLDPIRRRILASRPQGKRDAPARRTWLMPSLAAALALFAVGLILMPTRNQGELLTQPRTVKPGSNYETKIRDSLVLFLRSAENYTAHIAGTALTLKADQLSGSFAFSPNERLRSVVIDTPNARFTVVGTKFIIRADRTAAYLAVAEGKVKVKAADGEILVTAGNFASVREGKTSSAELPKHGAGIMEAFRESETRIDNMLAKVPLSPETAKKKVSLTLQSGSVITGYLLSETEEFVELQSLAARKQILKFKKNEIARMTNSP